MKGLVWQKFKSKRREKFSVQLQDEINEQVRATTEAEIESYTNNLTDLTDSLLTPDQDISTKATSTGDNVEPGEVNAGASVKLCSPFFAALLALGFQN